MSDKSLRKRRDWVVVVTDNTPVAIAERRYAIKFREERILHLRSEQERMEDQKMILLHEIEELRKG